MRLRSMNRCCVPKEGESKKEKGLDARWGEVKCIMQVWSCRARRVSERGAREVGERGQDEIELEAVDESHTDHSHSDGSQSDVGMRVGLGGEQSER